MSTLLPLVFLIFLLTLAFSSNALIIKIEVLPKIEINPIFYFNEKQGDVQQYFLTLENTGSVGCNSRGMLEFYNNSETPVYVAWSKEVSLWPGEVENLDFYTNLPNGTYNFSLLIQHCYRQFKRGPFKIEVKQTGKYELGVLQIVKVRTFKDYVEVWIKSKKEVENVTIIPVFYPFGWIFESTKIDKLKQDELRKVKVGYKPSIWEEANVTFHALTLDGEFFDKKTITLKLEKGFFEKILDFIGKILKYLKIQI